MVWAVSLSTMELIPHCLTPNDHLRAFVVWLSLVSSRPLAHPEPYLPKDYSKAAPQCISGRTSYLRVRLAFHLYPQLIPAFCTRHGFGPPFRYHRNFHLAMGSSPGFGSNPDNLPDMLKNPPPISAPRRPTPDESNEELCGTSASCIISARLRPIRTRFRCGSGTSVP